MNIELREVTVRDLVKDYRGDSEGGVVGYGGKLDIRPPFQREFISKDKQRESVIRSVMSGFPLNVMYWADWEDGTFEIIDGQQRTISIAQYVKRDFSLDRPDPEKFRQLVAQTAEKSEYYPWITKDDIESLL